MLFDKKKKPGQETANEIKRYLGDGVRSVTIVSDVSEIVTKDADIVLADGNPLVSDTSIKYVIVDGKILVKN